MWKNIIIYLTEVRERIPSVMTRKNCEYNPSDSTTTKGIDRRNFLVAAAATTLGGALAACNKEGKGNASPSENATTPEASPTPEIQTHEQLNARKREYKGIDSFISALESTDATTEEIKKEEEVRHNNGNYSTNPELQEKKLENTKKMREAFINLVAVNSPIEWPQNYTDQYGIPTVDTRGESGLALIKEQVTQNCLIASFIADLMTDTDPGVDDKDIDRILETFTEAGFILEDAVKDFNGRIKESVDISKSLNTFSAPYRMDIEVAEKEGNFNTIPGLPGVVAYSTNHYTGSGQILDNSGASEEYPIVLTPVSILTNVEGSFVPYETGGVNILVCDRRGAVSVSGKPELVGDPNSTDGMSIMTVVFDLTGKWMKLAYTRRVNKSDTLMVEGQNVSIGEVVRNAQMNSK